MKSIAEFFKKIVTALFILLIFILLLLNPNIAKESAKNGLLLAGNIIIPTLFPFLVCTLIVYKFRILDIIPTPKKLRFLKDYLIIFLLSNLGGYPIGAKLISEKFSKKEITQKNAELLLLCSINSGPAFSILAVGGGVLNSFKLGIIIYISQLISSFLMFILISKRFSREIKVSINTPKSFTEIFVSSVSESSSAMLNISGYIVICSVLLGLVNNSNINEIFKKGINFSLEISNAILSSKNVYILALILSFASFSIIFQVLSISKAFSPSFIWIILSRIFHSILSAGFTYLIIKIFPSYTQTLGNVSDAVTFRNNSLILTLLLLLTLIALVYSLNSKKYCGKISADIF